LHTFLLMLDLLVPFCKRRPKVLAATLGFSFLVVLSLHGGSRLKKSYDPSMVLR